MLAKSGLGAALSQDSTFDCAYDDALSGALYRCENADEAWFKGWNSKRIEFRILRSACPPLHLYCLSAFRGTMGQAGISSAEKSRSRGKLLTLICRRLTCRYGRRQI